MNKEIKPILDACCGGKMFYLDKQDGRVLFQDIRKIKTTLCDGRTFEVNPDVQADFTSMPYPDASFSMVVFDPPHLIHSRGKKSKFVDMYGTLSDKTAPTGWQKIKYGSLYKDWRDMLSKGFAECFRVLKPEGFLIFKWNETDVKVSEILKLTPYRPVFGHKSGKRSNTHWICFMKNGEMKGIEVFEAFASYGSQAMAAKRLQRDFPGEVEFEFVGISEIEPAAIKAYAAVHGDVPNFGDITKINWAQVPGFDLFTYSFPCTDISNAGKQAGLSEGSGTRSSLRWECERAIREKRPKYLLMENVKALVQKKFMPDFMRWASLLEGYGYVNFWRVLNAKDFGVAQNRERVFMVSILRTEDEPEPAYTFPQGFPLGKCVENYMEPAEEIGGDYFIDRERVTNKVLSDILDQPNVRAEMERLYHEEWRERGTSRY